MQAQDTSKRLIERRALAVQKLNEYAAGVRQAQASYQRAATSCSSCDATSHPLGRYGGKAAVRRDKPLSEKRCGGILLRDVASLQRQMHGRGSWLQRRRRVAYAACLAMIQLREAALALSPSPAP